LPYLLRLAPNHQPLFIMRIAIAQQNYHIGNFDANLAKLLQGVTQAREQGADIVVFSELSVCGYPPRDFLEFRDFYPPFAGSHSSPMRRQFRYSHRRGRTHC
jgi:predicted amidohydrolase